MSFTGRQVEERRQRCTDWPCCGLFLACLLGLAVLAGFGFKYGDSEKLQLLAGGRDRMGRLCGIDSDVKDFPLSYFTLENGQPKPTKWSTDERIKLQVVCTNSCPESNSSSSNTVSRASGLCPTDMYTNWCTWYGGKTVRFANYCLDPGVFDIDTQYEAWLSDLRASMYHLATIFPVSVIIGLIYLTTMEKCGGFFVWCVLLLVIVLPAGIGAWLYHDATTQGDLNQAVDIKPEDEKYIAFGFFALSAIIMLIACCSLKTINGVAAVVKGTSQFLKDVPSQFVQPMIFGLLHLVVIAAWLLVLFMVLSIGAEEGDIKECLANKEFLCMEWNKTTSTSSLIFLILMIYWILNFLHACSHFGTAFAVREWYFTKPDEMGAKRPEIGGHSICDCKLSVEGVTRGLKHHSGSFAFGSLCISICKVIRLLLFWVSKDEEARANNAVLKCMLRCANCIAKCIEDFVEFVSEHAYVEMALQGHGFCHSAKESMVMAVRKPGLFTIVGRVACMVKVLGVTLITILGAYSVRLALQWWKPEALQSFGPPVVAAAVFCLFIGEIMMHPFSAAARACLHCYVLDQARSVGDVCEHTPQQLQRFVETHDANPDHEQSRRCCC
jgi:hypothetical protein